MSAANDHLPNCGLRECTGTGCYEPGGCQNPHAAIVSRSDVIAAAIDVATNEGLDDDWECVRASDLDRLRVALGLTTGDRDAPE